MKKWEKGRICIKSCTVLLALMCCFGSLWGCGGASREPEEAWESGEENPGVRVTFFDVGKGDAILVETMESAMLIDAGYDDTSEVILDYLREYGIEKLDYLVITHFDKDHVGGADHILDAVAVGEVLQPGYVSEGKQYREYAETMEQLGRQPLLVEETLEIAMDGAKLIVYPPQREDYEEEDNDFSLVVSMKYGERSFLFAGDCERERLEELMDQKEFGLAHDVLKVPHHGRMEKNSKAFFAAVSPQIAVITCSEEKPAEEEVCGLLEQLKAEVYLSDGGTITCASDGKELWVAQ